MELPQYTDFGKVLEMNPFAAWQAGQQMDLAKTFQQEKLAQEQATAEKMRLANIYSEQINPLKVEEQRQGNLERQFGMPAKRVASEIAEKTGPQQMQAAIQDWAGKVSQGELDSMYREAQRMARTGKTPQERQAGVDLMQMHPEFVKLKTQHQQRMEEARFREGEATKRTGMTLAAQKERAAAQRAGKLPGTLSDRLAASKTYAHRAGVYEAEAQRAEEAEDMERAQYYRERAEEARQQDIAARSAAAQVTAGGQVSLEELEAGRLRRERDVREGKSPPATKTPAAPEQKRVRVKSPDGQTGTIPESQLQDAVRAGYVRVQ